MPIFLFLFNFLFSNVLRNFFTPNLRVLSLCRVSKPYTSAYCACLYKLRHWTSQAFVAVWRCCETRTNRTRLSLTPCTSDQTRTMNSSDKHSFRRIRQKWRRCSCLPPTRKRHWKQVLNRDCLGVSYHGNGVKNFFPRNIPILNEERPGVNYRGS